MPHRRPLPRSFYQRSALAVAPDLIGKVLVTDDGRSVRLVEVEAYLGEGVDRASHAFRGERPRTRVMFGPPGRLYVYFTYGMHWCANAVCGDAGVGEAVLIRAGIPLTGIDAMRAARGERWPDRDLCRGPARLTQALGLSGADGTDLVTGAPAGVRILDDGWVVPTDAAMVTGPRIGLTTGLESPWRWWVGGDPHVSATRNPRPRPTLPVAMPDQGDSGSAGGWASRDRDRDG